MTNGQSVFSEVEAAFGDCEVAAGGRSRAPLLWLLTRLFQLDISAAQDAICDNENDKGIDAIYVDDVDKAIIVLQSKRKENERPTAGDQEVKRLVGSMQQLGTVEGVEEIYTTGNDDLKKLIDRQEIRRLVAEGYAIRGAFITNAQRDDNTSSYLRSIEGSVGVDLYDRSEIYRILSYIRAPEFVSGPAELRLTRADSLEYSVSDDTRMIVGLVLASDVVGLPGVEDLSLFAHNVRLDLGNTRINRSIALTVQDYSEHRRFPTYHNGLTIVCKSLSRVHGKVVIRDFSVVNGCQSVRTLAKNRQHLSTDLKVLVKFVEITADAGQQAALDTIERVTFRSNNQNAVNMRDLRSGDEKQRSLAMEMEELTAGNVALAIQRGKRYCAPTVIENDLGAQLVASLYLGKPWIAHQKSKLFDSEYDAVFTWRIHAKHIYLAYLMFQTITDSLGAITNPSVAGYQLTTFVLLHALGEILRKEADGVVLLDDPAPVLVDPALQLALRSRLRRLAQKLMVDMNYFITQETARDTLFDHKRGFKQEGAVARFVAEAIRGYDKTIIDDPSNRFTLPACRPGDGPNSCISRD
jgi:hypothetical protein